MRTGESGRDLSRNNTLGNKKNTRKKQEMKQTQSPTLMKGNKGKQTNTQHLPQHTALHFK